MGNATAEDLILDAHLAELRELCDELGMSIDEANDRAELAELEGRLAKLTKYLDTDASRNLPFDDLNLLHAQRMAMEGYKEILYRRLYRVTQAHA